MANERLEDVARALYRSVFAPEMTRLDCSMEKTLADGQFEIEAAMEGRRLRTPAENRRVAQRPALMARAAKRDVDRAALREICQRQATGLGFDAKALAADAMERNLGASGKDREAGRDAGAHAYGARVRGGGCGGRQADLFDPAPQSLAEAAMAWAVKHFPSASRCSRRRICSPPHSPGSRGR